MPFIEPDIDYTPEQTHSETPTLDHILVEYELHGVQPFGGAEVNEVRHLLTEVKALRIVANVAKRLWLDDGSQLAEGLSDALLESLDAWEICNRERCQECNRVLANKDDDADHNRGECGCKYQRKLCWARYSKGKCLPLAPYDTPDCA